MASFNFLCLIAFVGVATARLIPRSESSSTTPTPFAVTGSAGGSSSIRCSASPEGTSKYNLLREFNEFMTTNAKFLRITYANMSEPQGELFSAFTNHMRTQNIQPKDAENLMCEFGSRNNLLSETNYAINPAKIRELINELPVDQQQKDTFVNNIQTCGDQLSRGSTSCDLSVFYDCLRGKCERGESGVSGGSGFQGGSGSQGGSGFQGGSGNQGGSGFQGGSGNQGGSGFQGGSGNQGGSGFQGGSGNQGGSGFQGGSGNQGGSGFQGGPGNQGGSGFLGGSGNRGDPGFGGSGNQGGSGFQGGSGNQGGSGFQGGSGNQGGSGFQGGSTNRGGSGSGDSANEGEFGIPSQPGFPNESGSRGSSANRG